MRLVEKFANPQQMKLYFGEKKNMLVTSIGGSLENVHKDDHMSSRSQSHYFLKDSYTAGSMASLGFSMAILGLLVGLLVGFILWKRQLGLPFYSIGWDQAPLLGGHLADLPVNNQSCRQQQPTPSFHGTTNSYQSDEDRY